MLTSKDKVAAILLMRFQILPATGIAIAQEWLKQNPESNWEKLEELLKQAQVILEKRVLKNVSSNERSHASKLIRKYRGVEITTDSLPAVALKHSSKKQLCYRGVKYS
jgi:hypothetical protein